MNLLKITKTTIASNIDISKKDGFYTLLTEAMYNTNEYLNNKGLFQGDKWNIDALLCNPMGNYSINISSIAIKFLLKQQSIKLQNEKELVNNN
jgi:hypothetical protein